MGTRKIHVQAHRGACSEFAENTLPAFKRALELNVDSIELDVHLTQDERVAVFHDFEITPEWCRDKLGNPMASSRPIWEIDWKELREIETRVDRRLANKRSLTEGEKKISSLREVFKAMKTWSSDSQTLPVMDIEIKRQDLIEKKAPEAKLMVSKVISEVLEFWDPNKTVLRSFDFSVLEQVRLQAPQISVGVLTFQSPVSIVEIHQKFQPKIWAPHFKDVNAENIKAARELGLEVIPYTVNKIQEFQNLIALGVTGLTTDDPTLLLQFLNQENLRLQ